MQSFPLWSWLWQNHNPNSQVDHEIADQEMTDRDLSSSTPSGTSSSPTGNTLPADTTLYYKQFKCHPPDPSACWTPWFLNFTGRFEPLVREALHEISFLEYIILVRTASMKPSHPGNYSAIIFIKENCIGTGRKASVLYVEDEVLNFINQEKTLQGMFLVPLEKEEGIFREAERVKIFQRPLAAGRSEEKLTHTVKGFLMLDSRMTAGGVGKEAAGGERRPVRKLAGSAMN